MARKPAPLTPAPRGVTLVELMVGMVIGLLAVLIITQVALQYEGRKRTVTSNADAQVNGALALQNLQRDIQAAGYGISEGGAIGCRMVGARGNVAFTRTLAPVVITPGSDGAPDALEVLMSNHGDFALPTRVASNHLRSGNLFVVNANTLLGQRKGDLMLAVPSPTPDPGDTTRWCSLFTVSADPVAGSNALQHDVGADQPWNHDLATSVFPGAQSTDLSYPAGSYLLDLGSLVSRRYCVAGTGDSACDVSGSPAARLTLRQVSFNSTDGNTTTDDLYPHLVQLQAVYGRDTSQPADHIADAWDTTAPATAQDWQRVIAVRVAVVARSAQNESRPDRGDPPVTPALPVWHPNGVTAESVRVDKTVGADWSAYRYKVFETVIPLRNVLWQPT